MTFTVEITVVEGEAQFRVYTLPSVFETVRAADEAAAAHIATLGLKPEDAFWQVLGPDGRDADLGTLN